MPPYCFEKFRLEDSSPYDVPESGTIYASVRLTQHGKVVAIGVAEWLLQPETRWRIEIQRSPYPTGVSGVSVSDFVNKTQVLCGWRGCRSVWRFDISEDALNYPDEALWMKLWGFTPCPPPLVCD